MFEEWPGGALPGSLDLKIFEHALLARPDVFGEQSR